MHEISIAENIINLIQKEYENNKNNIKEIHILVGELLGINPETLIFAFDQIKIDTKFKYTILKIEFNKCKFKCNNCGEEYDSSFDDLTECIKCKSDDFTLTGGTDIILSRIVV